MSTRQTKQIMQVTSRVIIMIIALYSIHTMLACGGSGDTLTYDDPGNGGDDGGDGSISALPSGIAILGTIDGEAVQVSDDEVTIYVGKLTGAGEDTLIMSVSNETSSASQKILGRLQLSDTSLIDSFIVGPTYDLNATELGVTGLGYIRVTSSGGTSQTYLIDSALLQFSELSNENGGPWSGIMQVRSDDSNSDLTIDFSGTINIVTE